MVCKEDVITWFKEAESYRRVDVMCSLLTMCVPFELRFLGSCIEEQGKHDYQALRGASIAANDIEKLPREMSVSKGLFDTCTRHRLIVYLSLLQSRNYACANWLYNTFLRTESIDVYIGNGNFSKDANLHSELLLLFTLAINHPAFTFEQKTYCEEVFMRLSEPEAPPPLTHHHPPCPPGLGYKPPLPVHPLTPINMPKSQTAIEPTPVPPPGISHPMAGEFVNPANMWTRTPFSCPPPELPAYPSPISPLVSQQSSPVASRSVSPSRMFNRAPFLGEDLMTKMANGLVAVPNKPHTYLSEQLQSLNLDGERLQCSSTSNSSNSSECQSPPPGTPTDLIGPHGPGRGEQQPKRVNGGNEREQPVYNVPYSTAAGFHASASIPPTYMPPNRLYYPPPHSYRAPPFGPMQNGDMMYPPFPTPPPPQPHPSYITMLFPSTPPPPAASSSVSASVPAKTCYNCGLHGHSGAECKEPSIEEITQGYQLDFTSPPPPPPPPPAPSSSSSTTSSVMEDRR